MADRPPDTASELYSVSPDQFVARRDALAKELDKAGRSDDAKAVKKLRKPALAVWAINQSARRRPDLAAEMAEVSKVMRAAGSSAQMREASAKRQSTIRRLVNEAASVLAEEGHPSGGQIVDKITRTLLALSTDESAQESFARGVLDRELEPELELGFSLPASGTADEGSSLPDQRERDRVEQLGHQIRELEKELAGLEREAKAAEDRVLLAQMEAERAAKRVESTRTSLDKARKAAEEAKAKLDSGA